MSDIRLSNSIVTTSKNRFLSYYVLLVFLALSDVHAEGVNETSLFEMSLVELMTVRVVSAASGFEQNLEDAPASVTVIDAEEWQAIGASTVMEAIAHVPGMHVGTVQVGLMYEKPIMRGLSGSFGQQVLLLIDGMPFRSPREGGSPWLQYLPLNSFKRIEVIRGSGSAIYGADAVGGIINLVSYKNGEVPDRIGLRAGGDNKQSIELSKAFEYGDHKLNVSWSTKVADSSPDRIVESDLQSLYDQSLGISASFAPGALDSAYEVHTLRASWQKDDLSLSYLDWYAPDYGNGIGLAQSLDPSGSVEMRTQFFEGDYDLSGKVTGNMNIRFAWHKFHLRTQSTLFPAGAILFLDSEGNIQQPTTSDVKPVTFTDGVKGNPGSDNRVISLQLNHLFKFRDKHRIRWAVGIENSDNYAVEKKNFGPGVYDGISTTVGGALTSVTGTEYVYLPDEERENYFVALQDQWSLAERWEATFGVRYDHYSDFGSTTNPRAGIVWHASEKMSFKAYTGKAFRAPSFVELYSQNNPTGIGRSELNPEQMDSIDVGFIANDVFVDSLQLETSIFQYYADDLVTYASQSNGLVAENSGLLKVRGIEQQVNWRSGENFSAEFNVSLIDPYTASGVDLSSIAQRLANLSLHYRRHSFHGFLSGEWVAKHERDESDTRKQIDDYFQINTRLQYRFRKWSTSLMVDNIFDSDNREPSAISIEKDYPLDGRSVSIELVRVF